MEKFYVNGEEINLMSARSAGMTDMFLAHLFTYPSRPFWTLKKWIPKHKKRTPLKLIKEKLGAMEFYMYI